MRFALISLLALTACKKDPVEGPFSECDPLDTALCALPWPSSFYLVEADTPTGYRVNFGPTSLPVNRDDMPLDPTLWNEKDGFSTSGPLMTYFADVSLDGVISHVDLARYLDDGARTVILDAETGERVPHWVELDMTAEDPEERLLVLRNAAPFAHARRYIVGIRGLTTSSGGSVAVSTAFAALRDGVGVGLRHRFAREQPRAVALDARRHAGARRAHRTELRGGQRRRGRLFHRR